MAPPSDGGRPRKVIGLGAHIELLGQLLRLLDAPQSYQRGDRVRVRPQYRWFSDADIVDRDHHRA
jgi:hypothetical protein